MTGRPDCESLKSQYGEGKSLAECIVRLRNNGLEKELIGALGAHCKAVMGRRERTSVANGWNKKSGSNKSNLAEVGQCWKTSQLQDRRHDKEHLD